MFTTILLALAATTPQPSNEAPPAPDASVPVTGDSQAAERAFPAATIDTNDDGAADAWDLDGDGKPDVFDTTGDGKPDQADRDGDGTPETPVQLKPAAEPDASSTPPGDPTDTQEETTDEPLTA